MQSLLALIEDRRLLAAVGGAAVIVAGAFLPWATTRVPFVGPVSESGVQSIGKVTFVLGGVALALAIAYVKLRQRDLAALAAAAALACAGLAIAYIADVNAATPRVVARLLSGGGTPIDPRATSVQFVARPGPGAWLTVAGAASVALATALLLLGLAAPKSEPDSRRNSARSGV
jgi:hypothetical protein